MPTPAEQLRRHLDAGRRLAYEDICREFEVTIRQARRYVRQLQVSGVPIREERNGKVKRFSLDDDDQRAELPGLDFDQEELYALAVAARASQAALGGISHGEPLRRAFGKLLRHVSPAAYLFEVGKVGPIWHFEESAALSLNRDDQRELEAAIAGRCSVRISYYTASRDSWSHDRKIGPLFIARRGRAWLCIAWCHASGKIKDFALDRISHVAPCDPDIEAAVFTPPDGFDPDLYFRDRFNVLSGSEYYTVRLLAERDRAPYFDDRRPYVPTQQTEKQPDGRAIVSFEVEGLEEIRSFVQACGVGLTVLEPPDLVARIGEEAAVLAARYKTAEG